jgi:hypothetical protein
MEEKPILLRVDPFIWNDESLNYPEKIILNLIFSFTVRGECCTVSDHWIGSKFGWNEKFSKEIIELLKVRGWINYHPQWDGGRTLSINIPGAPDPCEAFDNISHVQV